MRKKVFVTSWENVPVIIDVGLVAQILGVSDETIRKACVTGELPAFKINKMWRIKKSDLMVFCGEKGAAS